MNSFEVFMLLELFITRKINKVDPKLLRDFRSIVINHICSSVCYESFITNLSLGGLLMDKAYCSLLTSFRNYVRKVQKIYEGTYNKF